MNRAERRAREKEKKKESNKKVEALAWFRSLPPAKQILIDSLVKIEAKKDNDNLLQAIDRCFSAAVIQEFENLEWQDIERVIDKSAELMLDDAHKMKNLKESLGGSYDMAVKKVNEMGEVVEKRVRELITEGFNQKVSIKMLQEEFKDLSTAMLTIAYKKTKAAVVEEEKGNDVSNKIKEVLGEPDKEVADALEYIFEEENKAIVEEKENKGINAPKEIEKANTEGNKGVKTMVKNSKLRVRSVEGEHGIYNIGDSVVTIGEFAFGSTKEVNKWASNEREELIKQMNEIKDKINHINSCEEEITEVIKVYM